MQRVLLLLGAIIFVFIISADKSWEYFDTVLTTILIGYIVLWLIFLVFVSLNKMKKSSINGSEDKKTIHRSLATIGFGIFGSAIWKYFER